MNLLELMREDIETIFNDDPAAKSWLEIILCYPGLHAIWNHRINHWLWTHGLTTFARFLSQISKFFTGIEIHPGATIGRRFFIDHGSGIVIGETAEVGDNVLIYQGVVLGGTSLEKTKRHPTIGNNVVIGAGAILLGSFKVGDNAKVGAGSVVIEEVPAKATVVGVPGRIVEAPKNRKVSGIDLDHNRLPDPIIEVVHRLEQRIIDLEDRCVQHQKELKQKEGKDE